MKDKIALMRHAALRIKTVHKDAGFLANYMEFSKEEMKLFGIKKELDYYSLALCRYPTTEEGIRQISKLCNVDINRFKKWLAFQI